MILLERQFPKNDIVRPTIKEMRRGVYLLQNPSNPGRVYYTRRGIPALCAHVNGCLNLRFKLSKQSCYFVAWGQHTHHRGFIIRFCTDEIFDDLRDEFDELIEC